LKFERSISAFSRARRTIAGGVNSPVRAFRAVGGTPVFMKEGREATLFDLDGHEFIDYVLSWGPLILGHAHPAVVKAIQSAALRGTSFGTPTEAESELAELVSARFPSMQRLRFTSSGTEATMSTVRLARGFTKRDLIVKFAGCYHGHADAFLIAAGSGALTHGVPDSPGVPAGVAADTLVLPFNDMEAVREAFERHARRIAAVIVEPYAGNMGLVLPRGGYLRFLREVTQQAGSLLIFDEMITGFRVAPGGAQEVEGIVPDLTTLGKILGGGLPAGAFGGRADIMQELSPEGPVYQAGTLSGNPLAMAAGVATLRALEDQQLYARLEDLSAQLCDGLTAVFDRHGIANQTYRTASMFCTFFADRPVHDLETAGAADTNLYAKYFQAMLARGVYLPPSQFETAFLSAAHTQRDIERTIAAAEEAVESLLIPAR